MLLFFFGLFFTFNIMLKSKNKTHTQHNRIKGLIIIITLLFLIIKLLKFLINKDPFLLIHRCFKTEALYCLVSCAEKKYFTHFTSAGGKSGGWSLSAASGPEVEVNLRLLTVKLSKGHRRAFVLLK